MAAASRPHAVVVPYPCSGNINPALQLAKLLHQRGAYVTFVNTEHNHRRMQQAAAAAAAAGKEEGAAVVAGDGEDGNGTFRFETIPDGLSEAERGANDYGLSLCVATSQRCAAPLRELLVRLNATAGVPPVSCVVPTFLMSFALDVAAELGIPSMVLWGCSAGALLGHMRLRDLRERGYIPVKEASELEAVIDWIPGLPPMRLGDFSGFLRRTDDPDSFGLRFNESEATNCTKAGAVLLNTFEGLEPDALAALRAELPRVFTVGPLGTLLQITSSPEKKEKDGRAGAGGELQTSLWRQDDAQCAAWLDAQAPGSVVYVSFGSHAVLTPAEVTELAWGLAAAGRPFLWAVRDNLVSGGASGSAGAAGAVLAVLPPEFFAATSASPSSGSGCLITSWCAQERVLRHRAVGCFLTHGGWNSVCESLAAGVPMVCCPGFADQYTNSNLAAEVWGVAARLDDGDLGAGEMMVIRREKVAAGVREVMAANGMKKRAAAGWKAVAEEAARPGGTSYDNVTSVVNAMMIN